MKKVCIGIVVLLLSSLIIIACCLCLGGKDDESQITRIGIGGGGAFLNPMIDPTDANNFYVTSDMGGLYYSHDQGATWERTAERGVFWQTSMAPDSTIFAGGFGLYASFDQGRSLQRIYPQEVIYNVSRCGWNENLFFAKDYDNGYVKCITADSEHVYFVTVSWEGVLKIIQCDYHGDNVVVLHSMMNDFGYPESDIDMFMTHTEQGLYITLGNKIGFYDFNHASWSYVYTTTGYLQDITVIGDQIFFIDDLPTQSLILYTTDFQNFDDLMSYNTLGNQFTKYGREGTFNWHFKAVSGNNFENIFLSFSAPVNEFEDTVDGIMKFNGQGFEWVFDSMYKTRFVTELNGWSYGCHGPFYGITANPHNENVCLVANIETVYWMQYQNEATKQIKTLHGKDCGDGRYTTTGLDVQTTYFVKEDPFDKNHLIICTTDLGLQNSYDNGKTWQRMTITGDDYDIYNTCYDLYFDPYQRNVVYGLWSSRHDAPYNPTPQDQGITKGAFGISRDGGKTWEFAYDCGIPADAIPVKMSIIHNKQQFKIAVATFNRGFYYSSNGGENFVSLNAGMTTVAGLIYGEDVVLTADSIYCLTAPYLEGGNWCPSKLYEYKLNSQTLKTLDLGDVTLARSLAYSENQGLFVNAMPSYKYEWYIEHDAGFWVNEHGGIYHYVNGKMQKYFAHDDGIFYSTFTPDGKMYATDTYGKVFVIDEQGGQLLHDGLFPMLKNISFSLDGNTMYVTTFGAGVYRIKM